MTDLLHFETSVQWLFIGLKLKVVKYMYVYQTNIIVLFRLAGASKKIQSMTFSTEHRADLLTQALVSLSEAFNC